MKYVLTSGCSFTNNTRYNPKNKLAIDNYRDEDSISWPYYLQKELGDDFEVWNLGGATNDNVSIKLYIGFFVSFQFYILLDSIVHIVVALLEHYL